jgi:hypothetical protein
VSAGSTDNVNVVACARSSQPKPACTCALENRTLASSSLAGICGFTAAAVVCVRMRVKPNDGSGSQGSRNTAAADGGTAASRSRRCASSMFALSVAAAAALSSAEFFVGRGLFEQLSQLLSAFCWRSCPNGLIVGVSNAPPVS